MSRGKAPTSSPETDGQDARHRSRLVGGIVAAIAGFGLLTAIGVYVRDPSPDWRKPLVVLAMSFGFLGVWGIALWTRRRKSR